MERQAPNVTDDPGTGARARRTAQRLHWRNRATAERIKADKLAAVAARSKRKRELSESWGWYGGGSWVQPFADYLDLFSQREFLAPGAALGTWAHRDGRNYPYFQNEQELGFLRQTARLLSNTNGYAIGLVAGLTSYVIGPGYTYRPAAKTERIAKELPEGLTDSVQDVIDDFLDRNAWLGGEQPSIERECFWRSIEDGEFFLPMFRQPDGTTQVRIVGAEQVTQPPASDPREYLFGVYADPRDTATHQAYWVQFGTVPGEGEEFSREEMVHLRRNVHREVKRGLPDLSFDTAETLRLASVLRDNTGEGAAIQAAIVGVRQHAQNSQEQIQRFVDGEAEWNEPDYKGGQRPVRKARTGFEDMPSGMNYVPGPVATNGGVYLSILDALLRGAGQRWNAPKWLSSSDAAEVNFASSLTAESPFIGNVVTNQSAYREAFKRAVWTAVLWAAECGKVTDALGNVWRPKALEKVLKLQVETPDPISRDPLAQAQADEINIRNGTDSRQQAAERGGRDWKKVEADNQEWLEANPPAAPLPLPGDDQEPPADNPPEARAPAPQSP